ncbi:MAG TPA: cell division protein FtsZ [Methanomassiliicoccales archaeon]|nr:cell division protein FtsZ [Methanomassiliicoccales archaeon]
MGWEYVTDDDLASVGKPRIVVVGCGGGGCNSVSRMNELGLSSVETIAINTDRPHLAKVKAHRRLLIGQGITNGNGAGSDPEVGRICAENAMPEISKLLQGAALTFVTVGMGGGTGTGAAPVIADIARRCGSLVVSIATTPFEMEGNRNRTAIRGLRALRSASDTCLVLDNNRLLDMVSNLPFHQALSIMDELISEMVKGTVEAITENSLINLDFADLKTIVRQGGISTVLYGENADPDGVVKDALSNPLLDIPIGAATGAMVHVTGGTNLTLKRLNKVMKILTSNLDPEAKVIFGARMDEKFEGSIRLIAVVTGIAELAEDIEVDGLDDLSLSRFTV